MSSPSPFVISYFTSNLKANRRFYGDVLGLPVNSELPDAYFLCGTGTSHERVRAARYTDHSGCRDPDGRIVMVQLYNPSCPFHD